MFSSPSSLRPIFWGHILRAMGIVPAIKMPSNLIAFLWSNVTLNLRQTACSDLKTAFGMVWGDEEQE